MGEASRGRAAVELFDSSQEPHSKRLRYAVTSVAFVLLMGFGIWFYFLRFINEKRTVTHFMDAVAAENYELAYQIWKPHGTYLYPDFLADWSRRGYYGPLLSYRTESAKLPPEGGSGVIVVVQISPFQPFPANEDPNSARNREVRLWVERSDGSMSFPP
jgi:hypothetical protein